MKPAPQARLIPSLPVAVLQLMSWIDLVALQLPPPLRWVNQVMADHVHRLKVDLRRH
jgi:hypothetical protein